MVCQAFCVAGMNLFYGAGQGSFAMLGYPPSIPVTGHTRACNGVYGYVVRVWVAWGMQRACTRVIIIICACAGPAAMAPCT